MMSDLKRKPLVSRAKESSYGDAFRSHMLEQYKIYVQSAENVSNRRIASIRCWLTLNTALVALCVVQSTAFGQEPWLLPIPVAGMFSAIVWYQTIKSHKNLNKIKFDLIHEFEEYLPVAPFRREWDNAGKGSGAIYKQTTDLERWLPGGFGAGHFVLSIMIAVS